MPTVVRLLSFIALVTISNLGSAAEVAVPPELQAWQSWVLQGEEFRRCPFITGSQTADARAFQCAWPERLVLDIDGRGGRFAQRWQIYADSWVALPGNLEHWPRDVQVNGVRAAVVERQGVPHLRLDAGSYGVSGSFRWSNRPESLAVPWQTGIVDLSIEGQPITQPERPGASVWLGKRRSAAEQQQMELQVYRLVTDDIPVMLTTLIRLQVAGEGREELLAPVLPTGFAPTSLASGLPARLEPDGRLRVQVRAGSWEITIIARGAGVADALRRPAGEGPWAREEIWSFQSVDRLRVTAVEGVEAIDPAQANVPEGWREYPGYRMPAQAEFKVVERSRGLATADDNQLSLVRQIWFDFDHSGFTTVDRISGRMREGWRLDMQPPYQLMSASASDEKLLVTNGDAAGATGVELRSPQLDLEAVSRIATRSAMPATGWQSRFTGVRGTLHLPPGHRLLAAIGADNADGAWIERWRLLDMFLVLIASVAIARLLDWRIGALALVGLALTHHDSDGMIWLWVNLLIALVLAREAPEGRLRRVASVYRAVSVALLVVALVPFAANQARLAIHPQLDFAEYFSPGQPVAAKVPMSPASAPPAAAEGMLKRENLAELERVREDKGRTKEVAVTSTAARGINYAQVIQRYAPGTLLQTGPGIPEWRYISHDYSWSGPVDAAQKLHFLIITPFWLSLWRIVGVVLLGALLLALVRFAFGWPRNIPNLPRFGAPAVTAGLMAIAILTAPAIARAQLPDAALLNDLKARLTRAPECAPSCADVSAARVVASPQSLDIELDVSALTAVAVPVPAAPGRWEPESISIDGQSNGGLYRDSEQRLWVPLRAGAHEVRLSGRIVAAESVQIVFPQPPRTIEAHGEGWDISGVNDGRLLTNVLELVRKPSTGQAVRVEASTQFAPFVRVTRRVFLGLDWTVTTIVERLAPEKGAFTIRVPLLDGESVLTEDIEVTKDRDVLVGMPAGESVVQWDSGLPRSESLKLKSAPDAPRAEVWAFNVSPQWNARFEGTPAVLPFDVESGNWTYEFHPRPGEELTVQIARPEPVEGATLAFDGVNVAADVGKRSTSTVLALNYRSTQGGRHTLRLPEDARVTAVTVDDQSIPLRPENGELAVALLPGEHRLRVEWQTDTGVRIRSRAPHVDLGSPSSNIQTQLSLPADRWPLFALGAGVGPAILFWGELLVFVVVAVLLGRSRHSPLRVPEWLLLGLGLSTFSWAVLLTFAVWMFLMRWRSNWNGDVSRRRFNWIQVGVGVFSVIALICLVSAIPYGLLGSPDMRIRGFGSGGNVFNWFLDRSQATLAQPAVISVSLWWYKLAMLAWALWLSFALMRWLPWGWRALNANGLWRGSVVGSAAPPASPAPGHGVNRG